MAVEAADGSAKGLRSMWSDQRFRALLFQALVMAVFITFVAYIVHNTVENLASRGIASGFGFFSLPAGYDVGMSLIPYSPTDTHARVFLVGLLNTVLVSGVGVAFATLFGFIIGVLRLSPNWLINRMSYVYVEAIRNVPLLLQIFFWYAIFLALPSVRQSFNLGDGVFLNNRGLTLPAPILEPGFMAIPIALAVGVLGAFALGRWAKARQEATGQLFPAGLVGAGLIVVLPLLAALATGLPLSWELAEIKGFNFRGGVTVPPEFVALLAALSIYTSAFIAEIVRSGIQAVSHGQTEAAYALGLRRNWTMRLVILPQALRVIVPPLTSQYLNLTKNSSLGVAIGYPEIVATISGTTLNQTGQAIECVAISMGVYLSLSLSISAFMNWYNRRIALVER